MFSLAWPWAFLLLPLPGLLYLWLPVASGRHSALRSALQPRLGVLQTSAAMHPPTWRTWLLPALVWLLLLAAASRPQLTGQHRQHPDARDIMLAIDLSSSMLVTDMTLEGRATSRLDTVKQLVSQLLQQHPEDRFGLMFFGSTAHVQAPVSLDHPTLKYWLQTAQPGMAGENTAIGDAIGLALKRLRSGRDKRNALLLITDGANNSGVMPPRTAARFAAAEGMVIHTLGIGSAQLEANDQPHELDEPLLQEIAWLTGGRYLRIQGPQSLPEVAALLETLAPQPLVQGNRSIKPLHQWPLLAALLLTCAGLLANRVRAHKGHTA